MTDACPVCGNTGRVYDMGILTSRRCACRPGPVLSVVPNPQSNEETPDGR